MAGLFPPQEQAWGLDAQIGLTPQARAKVCREASQLSFDQAARTINEDWGTSYDGKQMQRWSEHEGQKVVHLREAERRAYGQGKRPAGPAAAPEVLVIGMDGGRVQGREKDSETQSRWVEDKVLTISSYAKGHGEDSPPERLSSTYVATLAKSRKFGVLARVEAERCGIRQAQEVVILGDGAAWIDTIAEEHFGSHQRIVDYYHAAERLCDCAKAVRPGKPEPLAKRWKSLMYEGKHPRLLRGLQRQVTRVGTVQKNDPPNHPRRILAENLTYFQRHAHQMNYPEYRARGWPIGSGVTESGVKLFNKRVKGTDQFWNIKGEKGVEAILALRALRLSQDDRWRYYMLYGKLLRPAA